MRAARLVILFVIFVAIPTALLAQQTVQPVQRDPQAIAILQQSLLAMGGVVPTDSVATGSVELVAGSTNEKGTVRILTRGLDQTAEFITTPARNVGYIYSRGKAVELTGDVKKPLSLELAVTTQAPYFPLVLAAQALTDLRMAAQYVGLETIDGHAAHHLRISTTAVPSRASHLVEFSQKDLWIDATTALPSKLRFNRQATKGSTPGIRVEISYSDFRAISGVLCAFFVQRLVNGTPFMTFRFESIAFNTGLSEAEFALR